MADDHEDKTSIFNPPLFLQRYELVHSLVAKHASTTGVSKLLDIGCGNCRFLQLCKTIPELTELTGIDVDKTLLQTSVVKLKPLLADYLNKKREDSVIRVYNGSAGENEKVLKSADIVTAIEVIEHLHEAVLNDVVYNIFNDIRPRVVVMTTPNKEYNVLFNWSDPNKFRHDDHKFEWTRKQFEDWAICIAENYGYKVKFGGVGAPPAGQENLGYCTQFAEFEIRHWIMTPASDEKPQTTKFELMFHEVYPGHHLSDYDIIKNEVLYMINRLARIALTQEQENPDEYRLEFGRIIDCSRELTNLKVTPADVQKLLTSLGYSVSNTTVVLDLYNYDDSLIPTS